jgi:hypothetical protein
MNQATTVLTRTAYPNTVALFCVGFAPTLHRPVLPALVRIAEFARWGGTVVIHDACVPEIA